MNHPSLDPSTRRPAPPPGYTFGRILLVNALVVGGILGLLALVSHPVVFGGFAAGVLLARSYHRLEDVAARVRDRMVGNPRRLARRPSARNDSTLMRP